MVIFNSETTRVTVERLTRRTLPHIVATPGGDRLGQTTAAHIRQRARQLGPLRLLCLGSVTPGKGVEVLLDAMATLPPGEFSLEIVGSTTVAPGFSERMRRKSVTFSLPVDFCGELRDNAVAEKLRSAHVIVAPSFYEGFGIALLEGMAHGLPAVAASAGAVPDLVSDGVNGYLVGAGDSGAIAKRLEGLGRNRDMLERLGLAALSRFGAFPTWDQSTDRILGFLRNLVRG